VIPVTAWSSGAASKLDERTKCAKHASEAAAKAFATVRLNRHPAFNNCANAMTV
jgi:hypothetical protein